ncbi:MAG: glycosyltransferase [Dehalococcoidia bacterium]
MTQTEQQHKLNVVVIGAHAPGGRADAGWIQAILPFAHPLGLWGNSTVSLRERHLWRIQEADTKDFQGYTISTLRVPLLPRQDYWLHNFLALRVFKDIVARWRKPDIIHSHFYPNGLLGVGLARHFGVPLIHTEHSATLLHPAPRNGSSWMGRQVARFVMKNASAVLCVSEHLRKQLKSLGFHGNLSVVPNPVDTSIFRPPAMRPARNGTVRLICACKLIPRKRVPLLLEAVSILRDRLPLHLDIIGDGPERQKCQQITRQRGIEHLVTFHGFKDRLALASMYNKSDIFVFASDAETFGVAYAEALCSGLPVVTTDSGPVAEIVPPGSGKIVPRADPRALARAIQDVALNWDSYQAAVLSEQPWHRFAYESVGEVIRSYYENIVGDGRRPGSPQISLPSEHRHLPIGGTR